MHIQQSQSESRPQVAPLTDFIGFGHEAKAPTLDQLATPTPSNSVLGWGDVASPTLAVTFGDFRTTSPALPHKDMPLDANKDDGLRPRAITYSPDLRRALAHAQATAVFYNGEMIGVPHFLFGLSRTPEGRAALADNGLDVCKLRAVLGSALANQDAALVACPELPRLDLALDEVVYTAMSVATRNGHAVLTLGNTVAACIDALRRREPPSDQELVVLDALAPPPAAEEQPTLVNEAVEDVGLDEPDAPELEETAEGSTSINSENVAAPAAAARPAGGMGFAKFAVMAFIVLSVAGFGIYAITAWGVASQ